MEHRLSHATVRNRPRSAIHVIRVHEVLLDRLEIEDLAERMRERLASRGEIAADVVVVQGDSKETLGLFGDSYSVSRVRAAMFNAALSWSPFRLG